MYIVQADKANSSTKNSTCNKQLAPSWSMQELVNGVRYMQLKPEVIFPPMFLNF